MSTTAFETIVTQGVERSFFVRTPGTTPPPSGSPIHIALHGKNSKSNRGLAMLNNLSNKANRSFWPAECADIIEEDVIVICPNGDVNTPAGATWSGPWETTPEEQTRDYVFFRDLIAWAVAEFGADPSQVTISGFSAGCQTVFGLSAHPDFASDYVGFMGIGNVVNGAVLAMPPHDLPASFWYCLGRNDGGFTSDGGAKFLETVAWLKSRAGSTAGPAVDSLQGCGGGRGVATIHRFLDGDVDVQAYLITKQGHCVPRPGTCSGVPFVRQAWEGLGVV